MIEIFSPDTFRHSVESASGGKATILYDAYGNPNFMSVIPKKTLGDLYPDTFINDHDGVATATHPAFIVQDTPGGATTEVSQIFISQYANTIQNNCGVSMPGQIPYHGDRADFLTYSNNKGAGWHTMNALEYGLLWGLAMEADLNVKGNTSGVYTDTTEQFNYSGDEAAKCNLFEIETATESCVKNMVVGEAVIFYDSNSVNVGEGVLVNTYKTSPHYSNVTGGGFIIVVQVNVGHHLGDAATFVGASTETGAVTQIIMHETLGAGPVSWTHNHSPWGVWMFGAGREIIESFMLAPSTSYSTKGPFLYTIRNNYREVADRDLEFLTTNISPHTSNYAQLGNMTLNGSNLPIADVLNNATLTDGPTYMAGEPEDWAVSGLSTNCANQDLLLMKMMGMYPVASDSVSHDYRSVWLPKENIRWNDGYFISQYADYDVMFLYRGGWQNSFVESSGVEKSMHSFTITAEEGTYYERNSARFRTVYIPEV